MYDDSCFQTFLTIIDDSSYQVGGGIEPCRECSSYIIIVMFAPFTIMSSYVPHDSLRSHLVNRVGPRSSPFGRTSSIGELDSVRTVFTTLFTPSSPLPLGSLFLTTVTSVSYTSWYVIHVLLTLVSWRSHTTIYVLFLWPLRLSRLRYFPKYIVFFLESERGQLLPVPFLFRRVTLSFLTVLTSFGHYLLFFFWLPVRFTVCRLVFFILTV